MSETIGETILPGTYIDVRAEGLIGVSGIATGNVGVVGTASRGPVNAVKILGGYGEALDAFGGQDAWPGTDVKPALTLVRTLEQVFAGGASTVYAVRVASGTPGSATQTLKSGGKDVITLTAKTPGSWANDVALAINSTAGTLELSYTRGAGAPTIKESFALGKVSGMLTALGASTLVTAAIVPNADGTATPDAVGGAKLAGGSNGETAGATEVAGGLDLLVGEPVNIVTVGSPPAFDAQKNLKPGGGLNVGTLSKEILAHLEQTENEGKERLAVVGAVDDDPGNITSDNVGSNARRIVVAPGLVQDDGAQLPTGYAAALVAGKLAALAPHVSLTNKDLPASGLTQTYSRSEQKDLLLKRVLVIAKNLGFRVLKGITTDTGAFQQISVRRIVDYAKAGVRVGSNPYIGKLNNPRVRAALKATLDGFLSGMILDEMLVAYTLDVSATRAQEIAGQAIVTMTLQPTFSIDFVKVIMNLD